MEHDQFTRYFWLGDASLIEVRPIKPGEGVIILETARELGKTHYWGPTMSATAEDYEAALFCDAPIIGALIAFVDGKAAGSALWHRSFSTSIGKEVMYLEDLVVLPDFRRLGVAEALMKELAKTAISFGYKKIFWLMMEWNKGARNLYAKLGAEIEDGNCYCSLEKQALLDLAK
jgi:GNAT superfamily N-acetyltransferase